MVSSHVNPVKANDCFYRISGLGMIFIFETQESPRIKEELFHAAE
jgi:hypothetical protein